MIKYLIKPNYLLKMHNLNDALKLKNAVVKAVIPDVFVHHLYLE